MQRSLIHKEDSAVIFQDLSFLRDRIQLLKQTFPESTLHAIAVKANPLPKILDFLHPLGVGAEAATMPELYLAEKTNYDSQKIVFDSPAKTEDDLRYALRMGVHLNADNFEELERIARLKQELPATGTIGLRINPQVGAGTIQLTSTAGKYSKLGVPLDETADRIREVYRKYAWLTGVHLHIGSQGCPLDQLIEGIQKVYDFIEELNHELDSRQIRQFDIGGGFPVSYYKNIEPPDIREYSTLLKRACPNLFSDQYQLITELGRFVHANTGWTASKVEYVKNYPGSRTAVIHVGADLLMRRCYHPADWHHEIDVLDRQGRIKLNSQTEEYVIAGPLCFGGDILAGNIVLPQIEEQDHLILHDTGAYTLSMWNRHLSRQIPKALGYYDDGAEFELLKKRETLQDIYKFWT